MNSIAIITARGGSKRIPKKNIKNFCGQPMIAYAIQAAKESALFDTVMVSTDSEEIAEVARVYGAEVPFLRSARTSDDYATTADVLLEVLSAYAERGQQFVDMCCLYPTAPFVTGDKLRHAHRVFCESDADLLEPVVAYSFPPQRAMRIKDGVLSYRQPEHVRTRSQDLEPWYHDAGQFYFYRVDAFLHATKEDPAMGGYSLKMCPFIMDEMEVQDIDNINDWKLAEMKYRVLRELNQDG